MNMEGPQGPEQFKITTEPAEEDFKKRGLRSCVIVHDSTIETAAIVALAMQEGAYVVDDHSGGDDLYLIKTGNDGQRLASEDQIQVFLTRLRTPGNTEQ